MLILRYRSARPYSRTTPRYDLALSDGTTQRAAYLNGCDGLRSLVRKTGYIDFPGLDASTTGSIAQVDLDDSQVGMRPEGVGIGPVNRGRDPGPFGVVLKEHSTRTPTTPPPAHPRQALHRGRRDDPGARNPR